MGFWSRAKSAVNKVTKSVTNVVNKATAVAKSVVSQAKSNISKATKAVKNVASVARATATIVSSPSVKSMSPSQRSNVAQAASRVSSAINSVSDVTQKIISAGNNVLGQTSNINLAIIDSAAAINNAVNDFNNSRTNPLPDYQDAEVKKAVDVIDNLTPEFQRIVEASLPDGEAVTKLANESWQDYFNRLHSQDKMPVIVAPRDNLEAFWDNVAQEMTLSNFIKDIKAGTVVYLSTMPLEGLIALGGKLGYGVFLKIFELLPRVLSSGARNRVARGLIDGALKSGILSSKRASAKGPLAVLELVKRAGTFFTSKLSDRALKILFLIAALDVVFWGPGAVKKLLGGEVGDFNSLKFQVETNLKQAFNLMNYEPSGSDIEQARNILRRTAPLIEDMVGLLGRRDIFKKVEDQHPEFKSVVNDFAGDFNDMASLAGIPESEFIDFNNILQTNPPIKFVPPDEIPSLLQGQVVSIINGNTFEMVDDGEEWSIKMPNLDTKRILSHDPIIAYAARVQRDHLSKLLLGKNVFVQVSPEETQDVAGHVLGSVFQGELNVNLAMRQSEPGSLIIRTRPSNALIKLSGISDFTDESIADVLVGLTGQDAENLPPGKYTVAFELPGFQRKVLPETIEIRSKVKTQNPGFVELLELGEGEAFTKVSKDSALVSISADPEIEAFIDIDGIYTGEKTPHVFNLVPGEYSFRIYKKGFTTSTRSRKLEAGTTESLQISMFTRDETQEESETTQFSFSSNPRGADIFLNNLFTGKKTPALLNLDPGFYSLIFRKADFEDFKQEISVPPFGDGFIDVNLTPTEEERLPLIIVNTTPDGANIFIDGLPTGKRTPQFFEIGPGEHLIRVEKAGFAPAERTIEIFGD